MNYYDKLKKQVREGNQNAEFLLGGLLAFLLIVPVVIVVGIRFRLQPEAEPVTQPQVQQPVETEQSLYSEYNTFYEAINKTRADNGLQPLESSMELEKTASLKLVTMVSEDCWAHECGVGFLKLADTVNTFSFGENLAYGYKDLGEVIDAWLNSPTHRANLLGNYKNQGVAILCGLRYQDFDSACVWVHHFSY